MPMKRTMLSKTLLSAALALALTLGCAELQSELDSMNKELTKPSDSTQASSSQESAGESASSGSEASTASAASTTSSSAAEVSSSSSDKSTESTSSSESDDSTPAESNIRVTLDGQTAKPDGNTHFWIIADPVSAEPTAEFTIDDIMGEMHMCIVNIYLEEDGREKGQPWAISDFNLNPKLMAPGKPFNLTNPGEGASIISPDAQMVKSCVLESGKRYIAIFTVSASNESGTIHVRFSVK